MQGDVPFHFTLNEKLLKTLKKRAKNKGVSAAYMLRTLIKEDAIREKLDKK